MRNRLKVEVLASVQDGTADNTIATAMTHEMRDNGFENKLSPPRVTSPSFQLQLAVSYLVR